MDGQSFVAMDGEDEDAASGMGLAETKALLESGDGGAAHVMVRNDGENPMEFDREDGICGVQLVDRTEIRAADEVTKEMRSGLDPECSALFAQYEPESKAEASGRREHETFTAVSLKEGEVSEVRHARRVGAQRSGKTGGLAAVASQKWCPEQGRIGKFKLAEPTVAREEKAYHREPQVRKSGANDGVVALSTSADGADGANHARPGGTGWTSGGWPFGSIRRC